MTRASKLKKTNKQTIWQLQGKQQDELEVPVPIQVSRARKVQWD